MEPYRCPICKQVTDHEGLFSPFCSKRCQLVDLGHWLEGNYTIEGREIKNDCEPGNKTTTPYENES